MLDFDLAELYAVETKKLNQAVKRNIERFPDDFMFRISKKEKEEVVTICDHLNNLKFSYQLPFAFTEQGVAMLSSVLRSTKAVEVNVKIMRAFVAMRNFLLKNKDVLYRLDNLERKQIEYQIKTDKNFEEIFGALKLTEPPQGIFFDGQVFDAYLFVSKLIRKAQREIVLIDNYLDESILELFTKAKEIVKVKIFTKNSLSLDISKVQKQCANISINKFDKCHDRFLIIDDEVYHFGASLKDLGKKWFAFSKLEFDSNLLLDRIPK